MPDGLSKEISETPVSRRDFLKITGSVLLAATFGLNLNRFDLSPTGPLHDVGVTIDFVVHNQAKDLPKNFDEKIHQCDIFIPEYEAWAPSDEIFFNDVSRNAIGTKDIDNFRKGGLYMDYFREVLKHLQGAKRLVKILDIPQGDPLDIDYGLIIPVLQPDYTQTYETHLKTLKTGFNIYASWNRDREDYILTNLYKAIQKLRQDSPARFGGPINIFMEYGAAHTRLYHLLNKESGSSKLSESFPLKRFGFLPSDEALRRYWFNLDTRDPKRVTLPDDDLMAKVVVEQFLMNWFWLPNLSKFESTADAMSYLRSVVNKFDTKEARSLWEYQQSARQQWQTGGRAFGLSDPLPQLRNVLAAKLKEKGVEEDWIKAGMATDLKPFKYAFDFMTPRRAEVNVA